MAAPTKLQFDACSETTIRGAKIEPQKVTFPDLNDHFLGREQQFHRTTSFLAKLLQTNEHVLEKAPVAAMALTLFFFCNPSKLPVRFPAKSFLLAEVNSLSRCSFQKFSPQVKKQQK